MAILIVVIILFTLLFFAGIGAIVFFAISHSKKSSDQYQTFASSNGYVYDKAMVKVSGYKDYSKNTISLGLNIPNKSPFIDKYANYSSFPFGRGTEKMVSHVIEGTYKSFAFRAFTYQFTGSIIDGLGRGGVFKVVMIRTDKQLEALPDNVFYENGILCTYSSGNLVVDEIFLTLDNLISIVS